MARRGDELVAVPGDAPNAAAVVLEENYKVHEHGG